MTTYLARIPKGMGFFLYIFSPSAKRRKGIESTMLGVRGELVTVVPMWATRLRICLMITKRILNSTHRVIKYGDATLHRRLYCDLNPQCRYYQPRILPLCQRRFQISHLLLQMSNLIGTVVISLAHTPNIEGLIPDCRSFLSHYCLLHSQRKLYIK